MSMKTTGGDAQASIGRHKVMQLQTKPNQHIDPMYEQP
jgi:hypothetical protein